MSGENCKKNSFSRGNRDFCRNYNKEHCQQTAVLLSGLAFQKVMKFPLAIKASSAITRRVVSVPVTT